MEKARMDSKWARLDEEVPTEGLGIAALVASIGIAGFAALMWASSAVAALPRTGAETAAWKGGSIGYACEDRISNLYLAGAFVMPGSGEPMNLWVGKPRGAPGSDKEVWGLVGKSNVERCEAQCKVTRFERFTKDLKPARMEMDCEGTRLKTMRMPVHVQWIRDKSGFESIVRLGSAIYGVEEAPLRIGVNRYSVASK